MKNIYFIILSMVVIIYILYSVRKGNLSIKTSFEWILAAVVMLVLSIFPYSLDRIALALGVTYPPTLLLTLCIVFLVIVDFNYSKRVAKLEEKITVLSQEVSILKEKNKHSK